MQGIQRTFSSETLDVKCAFVSAHADTLKHMVTYDDCDHCMVPWPPCMCQCTPQSDWYNIVQTVKNMSIAT